MKTEERIKEASSLYSREPNQLGYGPFESKRIEKAYEKGAVFGVNNSTVEEAKLLLRNQIPFPMASHLESVTFTYNQVIEAIESLKIKP